VGRIVVNIDPATGPAARRQPKRGRRWLRILAILALVVVACIVVVAIGGYFGWRRFQASPEYSLALLVDAAQRNDQEQLAKLIDDEALSKNMIASVNQKVVERYGTINATTQQQIDKLMPTLLPQVKQTIHNEVAKEIASFAGKAEDVPFIYLLLTMSSMVKITTEGDTAKVAPSRSDRQFDLTMHRESDRWKVVSVNDDAMVQRIADSVMKDLPPAGGFDANSPLFKNLGRPRKRNR